jgi:DeoR/GlpR family transcriptional regulator of sugar metabolism
MCNYYDRSVKLIHGTGMQPAARRERILALLGERRQVSVDLLARDLAASHETIRRDLSRLAERGLLRKVHGGAMLAETQGEGLFKARLGEHRAGKRRIARAAATFFGAGDTLFIDSGTTTLAFAEELSRTEGVTVVTNGTLIAAAMARDHTANNGGRGPYARIFLIGGAFAEDGAETVGPLALEQLRRFHAEHAVITVGAVDAARGVMDYNIDEAQVARVMIEQARSLTVIADASKLGRTAMFEVCPLDVIDRLVTDAEPPHELAVAFELAGVSVFVASHDAAEKGIATGLDAVVAKPSAVKA